MFKSTTSRVTAMARVGVLADGLFTARVNRVLAGVNGVEVAVLATPAEIAGARPLDLLLLHVREVELEPTLAAMDPRGVPLLLCPPLAFEADLAARVLRLAKRRKLRVGVSHPVRHYPPFAKLAEVVFTGVTGPVRHLSVERDSPLLPTCSLRAPAPGTVEQPWCLYHDIDLCAWLAGDGQLASIDWATGQDDADTLVLDLAFVSGTTARVTAGPASGEIPSGVAVRVDGELGHLACRLRPGRTEAVVEREFGPVGVPFLRPVPVPMVDPLAIEIGYCLSAFTHGLPFPAVPLQVSQALIGAIPQPPGVGR